MKRLPVTLLVCGALVGTALLATGQGRTLAGHWLQRVGFAPRDLATRRVDRLFTSAFFTHGHGTLWRALALILLFVGWTEWKHGSRRTAATFAGVHLGTVVLLGAAILALRHAGAIWPWMEYPMARDVGPSAGYIGCLGLSCARLETPRREIALAAVMAVLVIAPWAPALSPESADAKLSADLAHLIAFPLGWLSSYLATGDALGSERGDRG
jgi:hypothetical protein